jgi:hypothetical protein
METESKARIWLRHYKWYLLIALFFVVVITVMAVQTCTREEYDASVMYAGPAIIPDGKDAEIEAILAKVCKDNDGNGKVDVLFYDLLIMSQEELNAAYDKGHSSSAINAGSIQNAKDAFQLNILADEHFVMLLSPERYNVMVENGALEKLSDLGVSAPSYSEYAIRFADTDLARMYPAFSVIPGDTLLCFKRISDVNADDKRVLEKREDAIEYFGAIVAFKAPDGFVFQGE